MLDTDTTYGMTRPSAFGDLRFAGTIATGLVAGTLGLGALAAPLVGWKDWPSALGNDTSSAQTLKMAPANVANAPEQAARFVAERCRPGAAERDAAERLVPG